MNLPKWLEAILFLLIGLGIFAALSSLSRALVTTKSYDEATLRARYDLLRAQRDTVTYLSVGASHNLALDFGALQVEGFNFFSGGEDIFETEYKLAVVVPQLDNLACVLYPLSPGVLQQRVRPEKRLALYRVLGIHGYIVGDRASVARALTAPVVQPEHWGREATALLGRDLPAPKTVALRPDGYPLNDTDPAPPEEVRRKARARGREHRAFAAEAISTMPSHVDRSYMTLEAISRQLGERNICLILYTPPYLEDYLAELDPSVVSQTRAFGAYLQDSYPNTEYHDLSEHPAFVNRPDYFLDDHMNLVGARAFSVLLGERLRPRDAARAAILDTPDAVE